MIKEFVWERNQFVVNLTDFDIIWQFFLHWGKLFVWSNEILPWNKPLHVPVVTMKDYMCYSDTVSVFYQGSEKKDNVQQPNLIIARKFPREARINILKINCSLKDEGFWEQILYIVQYASIKSYLNWYFLEEPFIM